MKGQFIPGHKALSFLAKIHIKGFVCSGEDLTNVRAEYSNSIIAVPGISLGTENHDQKIVTNPKESVIKEADIIVVGRDIIYSDDPTEAARKYKEIISV